MARRSRIECILRQQSLLLAQILVCCRRGSTPGNGPLPPPPGTEPPETIPPPRPCPDGPLPEQCPVLEYSSTAPAMLAGVWTQVAQNNPRRVILSFGGEIAGFYRIAPREQSGTTGTIIDLNTNPFVMTLRDYGQAVQHEWWAASDVGGKLNMVEWYCPQGLRQPEPILPPVSVELPEPEPESFEELFTRAS